MFDDAAALGDPFGDSDDDDFFEPSPQPPQLLPPPANDVADPLGAEADGIGIFGNEVPPTATGERVDSRPSAPMRAPPQPRPRGRGPIYAQGPMSGELALIEPKDTTQKSAARSAGMTVLTTTALVGGGFALAGPWGGVAGLSASSALWNGYRAQKWLSSKDPSERHEAVVSSVLGLAFLILGGYAAYKAYESKTSD